MSMVDYPKGELTAEQVEFVRAAAARWRMDEAGPMMLEALRKANSALAMAVCILHSFYGQCDEKIKCETALASVKAAIAAAE